MLSVLIMSLWAADARPEPVAFVFLTPSGALTHLRSSDAIAYLDKRFDEDTDLDLAPLSPAMIEPCRGRLHCLAEAARPDYQRRVYLLGNGELAPFEEHLDYVERKALRVPHLMLVISGVGAEGIDLLTATLIDVDAALAFRHTRDELDRGAERALQRKASLGPGFRAELRRPEDTASLLERFFAEAVQPVLEHRGHWRPFGRVLLRTSVEGAGVAVDGRLMDTTRGVETGLDRIRPGNRRIRVEHPDYFPFESEVQVERRETTVLEATLQRRSGFAASSRVGLFWSGLLVAAAGTGLVVGGTIDGANDPVEQRCPDCSGGRFRAFSTEVSDSALDPISESGPLVIPLGYSLALTGATWSIGAKLTDERRAPWLAFALGLAGGGLAYGLSAAANPSPNR